MPTLNKGVTIFMGHAGACRCRQVQAGAGRCRQNVS